MSSLTGNLISSTYPSLLKIATNNTASANLNSVTDGAGNATSLYVSTLATAVSGTFAVLGSMTVSGVLAATASNAVNANLLDGLDSTVFATTGSNILKGNQIVSGSLTLKPQGAPNTPASGTLYFSSADSHFYGWNGSSWKQLDN